MMSRRRFIWRRLADGVELRAGRGKPRSILSGARSMPSRRTSTAAGDPLIKGSLCVAKEVCDQGARPDDFFTVETLSCVGLIRHVVFFVIDLPTRKVEIAGIAPIPDGLWMEQVARNLIDDFSGFLREKRFLIHDRDPLFTRGFRELLRSAGVTSVRLPPRSPNLNAFAERLCSRSNLSA